MAEDRLGGPCVPIGSLPDPRRLIVLAPRGLFAAGYQDDLHLGATFDEALGSLILGIDPGGRR
jgi:hypothetical protein